MSTFFIYYLTKNRQHMYTITFKKQFSEKVFLFEIKAPLIARSRKAGNFVIVRIAEGGERVPLTIADADPEKGTITIVVQKVGLSSTKLCDMQQGDCLADVVGPLGNPTHIENFGTVVCAGGGVGVAPMLPIVRALKAAGNRVLSVIAGRSKDLVILEDEVRESSDGLTVMTDDGSYGQKGLVTEGIDQWVQQEHVDKIFAIGPPIMMKFCSLLAQKHNIPSEVSLNTIMVDGTGMCGACRLTIGGKTRFVCIDGPEFDGSLVDWDEMFKRMGTFKQAERDEMNHFEEHLASLCHADKAQTGAARPTMDVEPTDDGIKTLTDRDADWRKELRSAMKPKERAQIERVTMPELDPAYRATTRSEEVNCGLTREMAVREAHRCLDCAKPACVEGCPVGVNIPSFIKNIERGQFLAAAKVLKDTSALPAVCGRVCPHEKQCEGHCVLGKKGQGIHVGKLERFLADFDGNMGLIREKLLPKTRGKVAVIGSGPAGLTIAGDLSRQGFNVEIFEMEPEPGGVLMFGIPEYRLPKDIVRREIKKMEELGVVIHCNTTIGKDYTVDDLFAQGFDAIFMGTGTGKPQKLDIPGGDIKGVRQAIWFLRRVSLYNEGNLDRKEVVVGKGDRCFVIGCGNTAMDAARTAVRLGAESVEVVYRRTINDMPALRSEYDEAVEEGVKFNWESNIVEIHSDENGKMTEVVIETKQGERRVEKADYVLMALGSKPASRIVSTTTGIDVDDRGYVVTRETPYGMTTRKGVFAGGDVVNRPSTVVLAMHDAKMVAEGIAQYVDAIKLLEAIG